MAPEWEMGMGMEFGMGIGAAANNAPAFPVAASPAYLYGLPSSDTLRIDDLLDFSNHDLFPSSADPHLLPPPDSSSAGTGGGRPFDGESGSSSNNRQQFTTFPDDLYIPSEEAAELEWLSKFVEESFSDVPYPSSSVVSGAHIRPDPSAAIASRGARSKRSRGPSSSSAAAAAAATWSSLAPPHPTRTSSSSTSSSSSSDFPSSKSERKKGGPSAAAAAAAEGALGVEGGVRRCTHCASEKTPQWRTGPLGPKTLCNACGVRYKSGRLVPEYRPAASPTFVLTQHSNSHRKVMELRRQKEIHLLRRDASGSAAASSSSGARGEMLFHDYEVC